MAGTKTLISRTRDNAIQNLPDISKAFIFKILQAREHNRAPLLSTSLSQEMTATGSRYRGEGPSLPLTRGIFW